MQDLTSTLAKQLALRTQLAAIVDAGDIFVKVTYLLEGDGPCGLIAYDAVTNIMARIANPDYSILSEVLELCPEAERAALQEVALKHVKAMHAKFHALFTGRGDYVASLEMFETLRCFNPSRINDFDDSEVHRMVRNGPFLPGRPNMVKRGFLKKELPAYRSLANEHKLDVNSKPAAILRWWKKNEKSLPSWTEALRCALLYQPSEASVERVFSLLKSMFPDDRQSSVLQTIETALFVRVNRGEAGKVEVDDCDGDGSDDSDDNDDQGDDDVAVIESDND
jgi:hypothetical protein